MWIAMGYVFDFQDAVAYERWFENRRNQLATELESRLMLDMLQPAPKESILDIGCGVGSILQPLLDRDLSVTAIDPSPYMLDIVFQRLANRVELYRGYAEELPFDDNSFNHACFFTSLEFVDDPKKALSEAFRVAKDKVFLGVLNRYALKGVQRRVVGVFTQTIYNRARFFSIWELKRMVRGILGEVPISWRTVCLFPLPEGPLMNSIERSALVQRCPFGTFAGLVVTLVPRFRTRPLALRYQAKTAHGALPT
jgi:SAM-dependent methyltransferase